MNHNWIMHFHASHLWIRYESQVQKYIHIWYDISTSRCKARLSPAFLPARCCAPGWTTPQLLTFGRLDASLQRCQVFVSSDISIISGIMEVKMVWRCQDKSFRPFFGFGAFRRVNVFTRKAWLRRLLWEMARCWSGNRSFLDTIRSISYRPGISCGDPSF